MRITLATETFFPQVNGVSRTLGELGASLRKPATNCSSSIPTTTRPNAAGSMSP